MVWCQHCSIGCRQCCFYPNSHKVAKFQKISLYYWLHMLHSTVLKIVTLFQWKMHEILCCCRDEKVDRNPPNSNDSIEIHTIASKFASNVNNCKCSTWQKAVIMQRNEWKTTRGPRTKHKRCKKPVTTSRLVAENSSIFVVCPGNIIAIHIPLYE